MQNLDIVKLRSFLLSLAVAVMVSAPLALAAHGLKLGLDLTGGTEIVVRPPAPMEDAAVRHRLDTPALADLAPLEVFRVGDAAAHTFAVRTRPAPGAAVKAGDRVAAAVAPGTTVLSVSAMGPSVGAAARRDTAVALALSCAGLVIYMAARFELKPGLAALLALVHDTLAVLAALALSGTEVDVAVVAALLTALGYSLNDSIVILDRVRENRARSSSTPMPDLVNQAVRQCLARTLITNVTVLLSLAAMGALGPRPLAGFVLTMTVGVISGTLSTLTVVCPLVATAKTS